MVQIGNVISTNIYQTKDKPLYHRGNTILIVINFLAIALFMFTKIYYIVRNQQRKKKWDAMTVEVNLILIRLGVFTDFNRNERTTSTTLPIRETRG